MKKRLLLAAVMTALTISTATAFAAPVITGDAQTMLQHTKGISDYSDARVRLNFDQDLGDNTYIHARLMGIDEQGVPVAGRAEYNKFGTGGTGANVNMEQLYLGAKFGTVDMKFGRQPIYIGKGLLADINGMEGIGVNVNSGDFSINGNVGRSTSNNTDLNAAPVDALSGSVTAHVGDASNLGLGYLRKTDTGFDTKSTYWSVFGDTKVMDNVTLSGEYAKNDTAHADGFLVKATVGQAVKKGDFNYAVSYRDIDKNAIDGDWATSSAFADSKGIRLEANYKMTNNMNLWVYQDITKQSSNENIKPNQFRAEIDVNF